jgi:hypothetical protein
VYAFSLHLRHHTFKGGTCTCRIVLRNPQFCQLHVYGVLLHMWSDGWDANSADFSLL